MLLLLYARIWLFLKGHQVQLLTNLGSQTVYIYMYSYFPSFWPAHWVVSFVQLSCTCHRNQRVGGKSSFKTLCTGSNVGLVLRGCSNLFWFQLSPKICFSAEASCSSVLMSPSLQPAPQDLVEGQADFYAWETPLTGMLAMSLIRQKEQRPAGRSLSYFPKSIGQQAWTTKEPK